MVTEPPYSQSFLSYTFQGGLPSGESWSCGLKTELLGATASQLQSYADQAKDIFATFWNEPIGGLKTVNPATVTFTKVTTRIITLTGTTHSMAESLQSPVLVGTATSQGAPNQCALVVTLKTALAGRSGRGRIYLPFLSPILSATTGKVVSGVASQLATDAATMINSLNGLQAPPGSAGPKARIGVQSRVAGVGFNLLTSVAVGDVCDTQRRRRDKEVETYSSAPITTV